MRIPSRLIALLVGLSSAACSERPAGRLTGLALLDGAPTHAGIVVTAAGPVTRSTHSDSDGHYELDALPDGDYLVLATAPSTREGTRVALASLHGGSVGVEDLHFSPLGIVRGRVTAEGGPASGAVVTAVGSDRVALTDSDGQYRLEGLPIGEHTLLASSGSQRASATVTCAYAIEVEAPPLDLLSPAPSPPPSGGLLGAAHLVGQSSHEGIVVTAVGPTSAATATVASGAWALAHLPDGHYAVTLSAPSTAEHTITVETDITGGTTVALADIAFHPFGRITGRATLDGASIGNAGIAVVADGGTSIAFTADDGTYTLDRVAPGTRVVVASHAGFLEARSIPVTVSYAATTQAPQLDLASGTPPANLRLAGHAKLVGLSDHSGIVVSIVGTTRTTTTAADGSYLIEGLAPGFYTVTFDRGEYHERVPDVLVFTGSSGSVVNGGDFVPLDDLELPRGRRIFDGSAAGLLVSSDGSRVLVGNTYVDTNFYTNSKRWSAAVDGSGAFLLTNTVLGQGSYPYELFSPNGLSLVYAGLFADRSKSVRLAGTTGDRELLLADSGPWNVVSNGRRMAVASGGNVSIFDPTGAHLTVGPADDAAPVFSADGTQLAFFGPDGIPYVYTFASSTLAASPQGTVVGPFSIDGEHLFCLLPGGSGWAPTIRDVTPTPAQPGSCWNGSDGFWLFPAVGAYQATLSVLDVLSVRLVGTDTWVSDSADSDRPPITVADRVIYAKDPLLLSLNVNDGTHATLSSALTPRLPGSSAVSPVVLSPDTRRVAFLNLTDSVDYDDAEVIVNSVDGTDPISIGPSKYRYWMDDPPKYWFDADGTRVVYETGTSLASRDLVGGPIWTVVEDVDTINGKARTGSSPDYRRAWAFDLDTGTLTTADPATGTTTLLIRHGFLSYGPLWVDDRTLVVARSGSPFGFQEGIYVVRMP